MSTRRDYGGTGWSVGHELTDERLQVDGLEASQFFIAMARKVHGDKFDYSKTEFRAMKLPVTIIYQDVEYSVLAVEHLMRPDGGIDGS